MKWPISESHRESLRNTISKCIGPHATRNSNKQKFKAKLKRQSIEVLENLEDDALNKLIKSVPHRLLKVTVKVPFTKRPKREQL